MSLESIGTLKHVYSLKKQVSAYAGNCIQIVRASDSTTSNIGFSAGELDWASLNTFLTATTGKVITWYDQKENANLEVAAANAPAISGSSIATGVIRFDGSSANMHLLDTGTTGAETNSALHVVWKCTDADTQRPGVQLGSTDQGFKAIGTNGAPGLLTKTGVVTTTYGVWDDEEWRHHFVTFNNGSATAYEYGTKISDAASVTNPDYTYIRIGGDGTTAASFDIVEMAIYSSVVAARPVWNVTRQTYSDLFTYNNVFFQIGDSMTSGTRTGPGDEWTKVGHDILGTDRWNTKGFSGYQLINWNNSIDDLLLYGQSYNLPATGARIATIWCGTNDMASGNDGATTFANLILLIKSLRQNGFGCIGVITALPGDPANRGVNFETYRTAYNNLIRANTAGFINFIVDTDSNPNLTDWEDTGYFVVDGVHLNDAGAIEVGTMWAAQVSNLTLSNFIIPEDTLPVTFAVRGDSLDARYSTAGKTAAILNLTNPPAVTTAVPGINGVNSISFTSGGAVFKALSYIGRGNTPSGRPRSVLMRVKFASTAANLGLFAIGGEVRGQINYTGLTLTATPELTLTHSNNTGGTTTNTTSSSGIGTSAWHDIVMTWTGDTTSNGIVIYVDAVAKLTVTATRTLLTPYTTNEQNACHNILIGPDWSTIVSNYSVDEFCIFDTVIDPTSVALTSGAGSLNGAARTAYVDVAAYDGVAAAQGGGGITRLGAYGF